MAEQAPGGAGEGAVDPALMAERKAMLAGFTTFTTYGVVAVAAVLILLAIFLV